MVALALIPIVAVFVLAVAVPGDSAAASHVIVVEGHVYDSEGNLVEGIPITINMKDGETTLSTHSTTSDGGGEYNYLFEAAEWEVGCTVQIIATGPAGQAVNSTTAPDEMSVDLDVHFSYEIPEFGFDAGVLVAGGAVGLIAVAMLVPRRK